MFQDESVTSAASTIKVSWPELFCLPEVDGLCGALEHCLNEREVLWSQCAVGWWILSYSCVFWIASEGVGLKKVIAVPFTEIQVLWSNRKWQRRNNSSPLPMRVQEESNLYPEREVRLPWLLTLKWGWGGMNPGSTPSSHSGALLSSLVYPRLLAWSSTRLWPGNSTAEENSSRLSCAYTEKENGLLIPEIPNKILEITEQNRACTLFRTLVAKM